MSSEQPVDKIIEGTPDASADLVVRAKQANEAAVAAVQARERDVQKKLASIPEFRAKQKELAPKQAEVATIIQGLEEIHAGREFIPEEQQAYEIAQKAAKDLAEVMAGYERELDKAVGDKEVYSRVETEAYARGGLLERDSKLEVELNKLLSEMKRVAQLMTETWVAQADWNNKLDGLEKKINNSLESSPDVSKLVKWSNFGQEWNSVMTRFTEFKNQIDQAINDNPGIMKLRLRSKLESLRDSDAVRQATVQIGMVEELRGKMQHLYDEIGNLRTEYLTLDKEARTVGTELNKSQEKHDFEKPDVVYNMVKKTAELLEKEAAGKKTSDINLNYHIRHIGTAMLKDGRDFEESKRSCLQNRW